MNLHPGIAAFDLEGALLKPNRPLHVPPHTPDDFYVFSGGLLHALSELGHTTAVVTRAEQKATEQLAVRAGIVTVRGLVHVDLVLGGEQSYLTDGAPGIIYDMGNKGDQLRTHFGQPDLALSYAVGDTPDDLSMMHMAQHGIAISPADRMYQMALEQGFTVVDEVDNHIAIYTAGNPSQRVAVGDIKEMPAAELLALVAA